MNRKSVAITAGVVVAAGVVAVILLARRGTPYTETVQTSSGPIRGEELIFEGTSYKAFKGIPYAAPPVGNLRFKAPQPPGNWTTVRDTRAYGKFCYQSGRDAEPSEDCLTLNVFTPSLEENGLKSVLVYIHGGGFHAGDGTDFFYGPQYLMQEDIVVVTLNYRLGALGFLSTNTSDASGNWGLKDQVAALKWVNTNIANFGGDPNQVTIYGASAGGASVHLHMLSPLSKGLFHRAILASGLATDLSIRETPEKASKYSVKMARLLGASENDIKDPAKRVEFLRTADPKVMTERVIEIMDKEASTNPLGSPWPFHPVIENEGTPEAFLTEDPEKLLVEGNFAKVPLMMGVTDLEGGLLFGEGMNSHTTPDAVREIEKNVCILLPDGLKNPVVARNECAQVAHEISATYFHGKSFDSSMLGFAKLCGDLFITRKIYAAQRVHAKLSSAEAPVYNYIFTFDGQWNFIKKEIKIPIPLPGAVHGDDQGYVFIQTFKGSPSRDLSPNSPEVITKNRMVRLISNFVKYGNPTPSVSDLIPIKWEPATADAAKTMVIGNELQMENEFLKTRMDLWDRLYERYSDSSPFI